MSNTLARQEKRSPRLALFGFGSVAVGFAGHKLQIHMPESWRGNGDLWDIWSHIGNVPDTVMAVGAITLVAAASCKELFHAMPLKRALGVAAVGFAVGCGANAVFETAAMQEMFAGRAPDHRDQLYGDVTALAEAGLLAWAGSRRSLASPPQGGMAITELPQTPGKSA
jgi:hypothetical protein